MQGRYAGITIPLVAATFTPASQPVLALFLAGVGTDFAGAAADTGLVATLKSAVVHISFMSAHIASSRVNLNLIRLLDGSRLSFGSKNAGFYADT